MNVIEVLVVKTVTASTPKETSSVSVDLVSLGMVSHVKVVNMSSIIMQSSHQFFPVLQILMNAAW